MDATLSQHPRMRRTVLVHGLLLALTLAANAGATDAGNDAGSYANGPLDTLIGDSAARSAAVDSVASAWRSARSRHAALPAQLDSIAVSNCDDSGAGSLREAIANAASGDTIDLTSTGCSEITLTTGALVVLQNKLMLQGPTDGVTIDAGDQSEVLVHLGNDYLTLDHLSIVHGAKYQSAASASDARGGCIASSGIVSLQYSEVTHCVAASAGPTNVARGGAIYATGGVVVSSSLVGGAQAMSMIDSAGGAISSPASVALINSIVTQGTAQAQTGDAHAGGIDAGGAFLAQSTAVLQNFAVTHDYQGSGGGVRALGIVDISASSFALNASITGGAIEMRGAGFSRSISNSTIAYNRNELPGTGSGLFAEGVDIQLQSTLIAFNGDLDAAIYADVEGSGTLSGANNLIHTAHVTPPAGTVGHIDPLIVPMVLDEARFIITLRPGSAAIDAGNNALALDFDQRGTGFPRQIGARTDIGAYEFDLADLVFANSFD